MAIFDRQIETIKRQLSGLETSQRVALGLCVVIIAGAIMMLSQWSVQREMVPLYADAMSEAELAGAERQLQLMGAEFKVRGDTIYVRPTDVRRLIGAVLERGSGPKNLGITFQKLIDDQDHFASAQKTQWNQDIALMNELAMTIEAWPMIKTASVFLARDDRRRLGKSGKTTAAVTVGSATNSRLSKSLVESLARLVAGAVSGLETQNVSVVDVAGRAYKVDDPDDQFGSNLYDLQRSRERELKDKIEDLLSYIPGVNAQVTVKLDPQSVSRVDTELAEPAVKRESKEETSTLNQSTAREPGVSANTSVALSGGGSGTGSSSEKTETEYSENRGGSVTQTSKKPGTVLQAGASIGIPRSYFVGALMALRNSADPDPTSDEIDAYVEEQRIEIVRQVKPILDANAERESEVVVTVYADDAVAFMPTSPIMQTQDSPSVMDFVTSHGQKLGLGALALMALGMMLMLVRKGADAAVAPMEEKQDAATVGPLGELMVDGAPVGKAGSPDAFLIAQETDENSVRSRQIAQQVSDLINDDPEGAAQLVRRWIDREQ